MNAFMLTAPLGTFVMSLFQSVFLKLTDDFRSSKRFYRLLKKWKFPVSATSKMSWWEGRFKNVNYNAEVLKCSTVLTQVLMMFKLRHRAAGKMSSHLLTAQREWEKKKSSGKTATTKKTHSLQLIKKFN